MNIKYTRRERDLIARVAKLQIENGTLTDKIKEQKNWAEMAKKWSDQSSHEIFKLKNAIVKLVLDHYEKT